MSDNDDSDLQARHRKERKDLQATIQALKKTASKGDKKKKKEVLEEIARLETDLEKRHDEELQNEKNTEEISSLTIDDSAEKNPVPSENLQQSSRLSKAQKRRDKKAVEEKERLAEISAQEKFNVNAPRNLETKAIKKILKKRELGIFQIQSDGDCLYNAVKHQLVVMGREYRDVSTLRELTADYIQANKDSLIFYMTNPATGDCLTDSEFSKYCESVRSTKAWGGQVEIQALSNSLRVPIEILQATGPPTIQGENEYPKPNLVLTYHRHMYALGEHYNSTTPVSDTANEEEEEKS